MLLNHRQCAPKEMIEMNSQIIMYKRLREYYTVIYRQNVVPGHVMPCTNIEYRLYNTQSVRVRGSSAPSNCIRNLLNMALFFFNCSNSDS